MGWNSDFCVTWPYWQWETVRTLCNLTLQRSVLSTHTAHGHSVYHYPLTHCVWESAWTGSQAESNKADHCWVWHLVMAEFFCMRTCLIECISQSLRRCDMRWERWPAEAGVRGGSGGDWPHLARGRSSGAERAAVPCEWCQQADGEERCAGQSARCSYDIMTWLLRSQTHRLACCHGLGCHW